MIKTIYNCTNCGHEKTYEYKTLRESANMAASYWGGGECGADYDDHHYGFVGVEADGDEIALHEILWARGRAVDGGQCPHCGSETETYRPGQEFCPQCDMVVRPVESEL